MTIPYPYISGSLHLGHARVVTEADVYARHLRMRGKNVLFPLSFHISGTPVLGISLAIKNKDQKKIVDFTFKYDDIFSVKDFLEAVKEWLDDNEYSDDEGILLLGIAIISLSCIASIGDPAAMVPSNGILTIGSDLEIPMSRV